MLAMSGDLSLEAAAVVIAALDRAGGAVHPEVVLDLRALSLVGPGARRAPVTAEALAGLRGGGPVARVSDPAPRRLRRRRLPARCRSLRGWPTPEIV